ncbi:hypothetical protein BJ508DRAFT_307578 [Ascobolus immersus RN42]|uniref:Uncharacterized protein n=1 Tax=Ascobolus immersus RN42 TaxID=1160509 RepID=A0A3N4I6R6_ASCIM|nr:hypothetical protein BJ508DRAFT_307578 [Ascobolus immersus RN42]
MPHEGQPNTITPQNNKDNKSNNNNHNNNRRGRGRGGYSQGHIAARVAASAVTAAIHAENRITKKQNKVSKPQIQNRQAGPSRREKQQLKQDTETPVAEPPTYNKYDRDHDCKVTRSSSSRTTEHSTLFPPSSYEINPELFQFALLVVNPDLRAKPAAFRRVIQRWEHHDLPDFTESQHCITRLRQRIDPDPASLPSVPTQALPSPPVTGPVSTPAPFVPPSVTVSTPHTPVSIPFPARCPPAPVAPRIVYSQAFFTDPVADRLFSSNPTSSEPSPHHFESDEDQDISQLQDDDVDEYLSSFIEDLDTHHPPSGRAAPPPPGFSTSDILSQFRTPSAHQPIFPRYGYNYVDAAQADQVNQQLLDGLNPDYASTTGAPTPASLAPSLSLLPGTFPDNSFADTTCNQTFITARSRRDSLSSTSSSPLGLDNVLSNVSSQPDKSVPTSSSLPDNSVQLPPLWPDNSRPVPEVLPSPTKVTNLLLSLPYNSSKSSSRSSPPNNSVSSETPVSHRDTMAFTSEQMAQFKEIAALFKQLQEDTATTASTQFSNDYFKQHALRPEVAGLFWPDYDPRAQGHHTYGSATQTAGFESLITNKDGTFYKEILAWIDAWPRMSDVIGGDVKLAAGLEYYIRGSAKFWWSFTLTDAERKAMREDLAVWKQKALLHLAPKASTALAQLAAHTYGQRDVVSVRSIAVWFHQRYRCVQQAGITKVGDILQDYGTNLARLLSLSTTGSLSPYRGITTSGPYQPMGRYPTPGFTPATRLPFAPYGMGRGSSRYNQYTGYRNQPMRRYQYQPGLGRGTGFRGYGQYGQSDARGYGAQSQNRPNTNTIQSPATSATSMAMVLRNSTTPPTTTRPTTSASDNFADPLDPSAIPYQSDAYFSDNDFSSSDYFPPASYPEYADSYGEEAYFGTDMETGPLESYGSFFCEPDGFAAESYDGPYANYNHPNPYCEYPNPPEFSFANAMQTINVTVDPPHAPVELSSAPEHGWDPIDLYSHLLPPAFVLPEPVDLYYIVEGNNTMMVSDVYVPSRNASFPSECANCGHCLPSRRQALRHCIQNTVRRYPHRRKGSSALHIQPAMFVDPYRRHPSQIIKSSALPPSWSGLEFRGFSYARLLVSINDSSLENMIPACLDGGCGMSLIDERFCQTIDLTLSPRTHRAVQVEVQGIGGARHTSTEFVSLWVYAPEAQPDKDAIPRMAAFRRDFHIVPDLKCQILIGNDIAATEKLLVDFGAQTVTFPLCENITSSITVVHPYAQQAPTPRTIRSSSRMVLAPHSLTYLPIYTGCLQTAVDYEFVLFTPATPSLIRQWADINNLFLDAASSVIHITNSTPFPLLIPRNTPLGLATPIEATLHGYHLDPRLPEHRLIGIEVDAASIIVYYMLDFAGDPDSVGDFELRSVVVTLVTIKELAQEEDRLLQVTIVPVLDDILDRKVVLFHDCPWDLVHAGGITAFPRSVEVDQQRDRRVVVNQRSWTGKQILNRLETVLDLRSDSVRGQFP